MKKYLILFLLLLSLNSYSQVDSTKVWEARKEWLSKPDNYSQGQQMPVWDTNGNVIVFTTLLLFLFYYKNQKVKVIHNITKSRYGY